MWTGALGRQGIDRENADKTACMAVDEGTLD
jgi:hypothetical protein